MTQDWKLTVTMKDYGNGSGDQGIMDALAARLAGKFSAQFFWYNGEKPAEFTHDGKGVITSTVFDAKIQNDLPDWWGNSFPADRDFEVVVNEENGEDEIRWQFTHGRCTSCVRDGEELVEQGGAEDLSVSGGCGTVQFYARVGAVPNSDGKYDKDDYIGVVDDDWLIKPDDGNSGDIFVPVGVDTDDLPSSDDDDDEYDEDDDDDTEDYDEELRKAFLDIYESYVVPYIKKGKRIGTKQMVFDASHGHENGTEYENEDDGIFDELNWVSSDEDEDKVCFFLNEVNVENNDGLLETSDGVLLCCDEGAESVTIPDSVTEISGYAFEGCASLKEVRYGGTQAQWFMQNCFSDLPENTVVHCSDGDFVNPKAASEYAIPEGVTEIGSSAFSGCTSLASVKIPAGVTTISDSAFKGCTALKNVCYDGTQAQWFLLEGYNLVPADVAVHCSDGDFVNPKTATAYVIPESMTEIASSMFEGSTLLASVTIPVGVTKIGSSARRLPLSAYLPA